MGEIHGHDVLEMMLASGKTYTRASLLEDIRNAFGPDARFRTCSAENLTAEGLVDFLQAKGKFIPRDDRFQTSRDLVCQHER